MEERYKKLNNYLKERFGERTLKICIDGSFTCPNRDGTCATGGCIFCSNLGSGDLIKNSKKNISEQVKDYLNSYKSERANKFIVYFQNYTNTYDSIENLKSKYDSALIDPRIVGISVATRPDCINEDIVRLLKTYQENYHVFVELGLQTSNNNTGKIINRGYNSEKFVEAMSILNKYNIETVVHIMVGLPTEDFNDLKTTVSFINKMNINGIKIHSTYVLKNTVLEKLYENGKYTPISKDYYMKCLAYIISHISPNIVIHRFTGDPPKELLVAPDWCVHKKWILNNLNKYLVDNDLWQGKYYN